MSVWRFTAAQKAHTNRHKPTHRHSLTHKHQRAYTRKCGQMCIHVYLYRRVILCLCV
uniref:Uncharacterized protein n=1 Tax=Anabas testudineus TaxID=64144 RepID=A0A7N5ZSZ4_ANATE